MKIFLGLLSLLSVLLLAAPPAPAADLTAHGLFSTNVLFRTDSDFDHSAPVYDAKGQTVGQAATLFRPDFLWTPAQHLQVFYQVELGWNAWARNNPDQGFAGDQSAMLLKHRELWASVMLPGKVLVKTGYQYLQDPSGVYLAHWAGAVSLTTTRGLWAFEAALGQLPDDSYEGLVQGQTGFTRDVFFLNLGASRKIHNSLDLDLFLGGMGDYTRAGRSVQLATLEAGFRYKHGNTRGQFHALTQAGVLEGYAVGGANRYHGALAVQGGVSRRSGPVYLSAGALLLSPDDDEEGDNGNSAFFYSGKNRSPSLILSEDELRDRYDNLDERVSQTLGSFFVNRAGLLLLDASVGYSLTPRISPVLVLAGGFSLNPENSGGGRLLGLESDLVVDFAVLDQASFLAVAQVFLPGEASSVFVNEAHPFSTDPVAGFQAAFAARF
jgi:hypothetical protein